MEAIGKAAASALIAYSAHYGASKLYNSFCVPDGIWGYVQGLVTTGSPLCQAGVQVISNTQISYSSMIMMGITRIFVDMVAPGATKTG
jgi:hypothetical protein